jgi:hypothetical protein
MAEFTTKDSGQHAEYASGMRRDTQDGKPRFALMVTKLQPYEEQMLTRYAGLLARGADKYEDRNWEDGDSEEELERAKDSLLRHTMQLLAGETDEDHAAAVWFNTQAVEYFRWRIAQKTSPAIEINVPKLDSSNFLAEVRKSLSRTQPPKVVVGSSELDRAKQVDQREDDLDEGEIARQKHRDSLQRWHNRSVGAVDQGNFGE